MMKKQSFRKYEKVGDQFGVGGYLNNSSGEGDLYKSGEPELLRYLEYNFFKKRSENFSKNFLKTFIWLVRSCFFSETDRDETIRLVRKSSKSELSSQFFGRLKIFIGLGSLAR